MVDRLIVDSSDTEVGVGTVKDAASNAVNASIVSLLRKLLEGDVAQVVNKTYTLATATTGATGTHTLFTVTGVVRMKLYAACKTTCVPAVAGATIEVGTPATTAGLIAQTLATDLIAGEIWDDASPTTKIEPDANIPEVIIGDGADIGIKITTQAVESGVIDFRLEYTPISSDGAVVAV
jgi:hypothetical protein